MNIADEPSKEKRAEEKFVRDALTRGDAAKPDKQGTLPPGATHEIVEQGAEAEDEIVKKGEEAEDKPPTIKRRRFSIS